MKRTPPPVLIVWSAGAVVLMAALVILATDSPDAAPSATVAHPCHRESAHRDLAPTRLRKVIRRLGEIEPARVVGVESGLAAGPWTVTLPNGRVVLTSTPESNVRKHPYVMSPIEFANRRPGLARALGDSMDHDEHNHCGLALLERAPSVNAEGAIFWRLALHVSAREGLLTIDGVEPLPWPPHEEDGWPRSVDQEARDCFIHMFRGHTVAWPTDEDLWFEFDIIIMPREDP